MLRAALSYRQKNPIRLLCEIDIKRLFSAPKERGRFDKNWEAFLESGGPYGNSKFIEYDIRKQGGQVPVKYVSLLLSQIEQGWQEQYSFCFR